MENGVERVSKPFGRPNKPPAETTLVFSYRRSAGESFLAAAIARSVAVDAA